MTATATRKRSRGTTLSLAGLRAALAAVLPAVPHRGTKPVLTNVLLRDGVLTGSDLEMQIQVPVEWHGDPLLLPAHRLQAILTNAVGDEVTLSPDGTACVVTAGRGSWRLPVEDAAEFPAWEPANAKPICRLPADQFARAVKSTVYATDNQSSRYALGGVLVEVKDGAVHFVGTDGRRLSVYECEIDQAVDDGQVLIPSRAIQAMAKLASGDGAVQLEATGSEAIAECDGTTVTSRLVEGRFPRWRDTLPERENDRWVVNGSDLLAATKAAAICTSESSLGVMYTFTPEGIHLTGKSSEAGESSVTCPVESAGVALAIKLDPAFVVEFLRNLDDQSVPVEVDVVDSVSAAIIHADDATGVIMPLAAE